MFFISNVLRSKLTIYTYLYKANIYSRFVQDKSQLYTYIFYNVRTINTWKLYEQKLQFYSRWLKSEITKYDCRKL